MPSIRFFRHGWAAASVAFAIHAGAAAPAIPLQQAPTPNCTIDLYGDSILHGAYVRKQDGKEAFGRWQRHPSAEIKTQRPGYVVNDMTVSGQSLAMMFAAYKPDPAARIVVLGNGIAEGWYGGDLDHNLRTLVQSVRANGGIPVITGFARQVPNHYMTAKKLAGRDRAEADARAVAESMNVAFVDLGAAGPVEIVDDVHPSEACSLRLTARLIETLDRITPECSDWS